MASSSSFGPNRRPAGTPGVSTSAPSTREAAARPRSNAQSGGQRGAPQHEPAPPADLLEPLKSAPVNAAMARHEAAIDPILRGTRPLNGTTNTAAEIGEAKSGAAGAGLTTYATSFKVENVGGHGAGLTLDRQSALVGTSIPLNGAGATGERVALAAGPIGPLGYGGVTYHDGHGNGFGGFLMATTGGTPGIGASYSHLGPNGGFAASPSVLVDKTGSADVSKVIGDKASIEQKSSRMVLGNLPISGGHAGFAVAARAVVDASETNGYAYEAKITEAGRKAPKNNFFTRRVEGFRPSKKLPAMPSLNEVGAYAPGSKRTLQVEHNQAYSVGASAGGVQLIVGRASGKKTAATVEVPATQASGEAARVSVSLSETNTAGKLLGADVPALLAVHVGTQSMTESAVTYKFAQGDAEGPKAVLARNSRFGVAGHLKMPEQFEAVDVSDVVTAAETLDTLRGQNASVEGIRLAAAKGGLSWRVNVMSLPSTLLGPRFGLAYGQDRGREVHYASAVPNLSVVARGQQQRVQRELPYVGGSSRQLELLKVTARRAEDDAPVQLIGKDVIRYKETHTHARQATLLDAQQLLRSAVSSKLRKKGVGTAQKPPMPMDLELELQLVVTPSAVRALSRSGSLLAELGAAPPSDAPVLTQRAFHDRGVALLQDKLRRASRKEVVRILAALDEARAEVTVNVETNLFSSVEKVAAQVQVDAAKARRKGGPKSPTLLLTEVLPKAAEAADKLHGAWDILQSPLLQHDNSKLFSQRKENLRRSYSDLSKLFAFHNEADKENLPTAVSPSTRKFLDKVAPERAMLSPQLDDGLELPNPMEALYIGGEALRRS